MTNRKYFELCKKEKLDIFREFVKGKMLGDSSCKKDSDCTFISSGEGYVTNKVIAAKTIICIEDVKDAFSDYCLRHKDRKKSPQKTDMIYLPIFFVKAPTLVRCERNTCVAEFDRKTSKTVKFPYQDGLPGTGCRKEAEQVFDPNSP